MHNSTNNKDYDYSNASIRSLSAKAMYGDERAKLFLKAARIERAYELKIQLSPEDIELIGQYTWNEARDGYITTNVNAPEEYANVPGGKFQTTLNRLVLSRMLGLEGPWLIPSDIHADHVDVFSPLADCRRSNIQPLSCSENSGKTRRTLRKEVA